MISKLYAHSAGGIDGDALEATDAGGEDEDEDERSDAGIMDQDQDTETEQHVGEGDQVIISAMKPLHSHLCDLLLCTCVF